MKTLCAAACVGLAAWCSLGTLGLAGAASDARIALLPPWWLLATLILAALAGIRAVRLSPSQIGPLFGSAVVILPWLPVPLPPAALLWTGPFAAGIWMVVVIGVVASGPPVRSRWLTDRRRAPIAAAALALTVYAASAWWVSPVLPDGDSPHYLILARSLISDGDLRIENNHQQGDYLEFSLNAERPHYLRRGVDGAIYSIHAPGLPVLIAPALFLFGYPGTVAFLGLIAALSTALVWHFGYRTTGSASAAWFGWACCALTTPFVFQATQVFPDGVAATCVLLGTLPLIATGFREETEWEPMWLLSGVSLAILPWLQTRLALIAAAAALCVCARMRHVRQFLMFAVVPAAGAAAWFGYFYVLYGTLNPAAPYGTYTQTTVANLARGGPGLIFDQQFGLVPNAPVYGFILAAVIAGAARLRCWSAELLVVMVPYMIGVGMFQIWWGGTSAPVRLLAPFALLLGVAAARIWNDARAPETRAVGLVTLGASLLVAAVLAGPDRGLLLLNDVALWLDWSHDLLDLPRGLPSVFRDMPGQAWLKAGIWGLSVTAGWLTIGAVGARDRHGRASSSAPSWAAIWCLAVTVMVSLTLCWRIGGVQPITPATAELALWRGASRLKTVAYDYESHRVERPRAVLAGLHIRTDRQRRLVPPGALLSLWDVPAGTYDVRLVSSGPADGRLVLRAGDSPLPLWTGSTGATASAGPLAGGQPEALGPPLRLPVRLRSLVVEGDDLARRTINAVELEPRDVDRAGGRGSVVTRGVAHRAVRYASTDVYFMDDHAYAEPSGFWVAGGYTARVVVAQPGAPLQLFLRNAPVENDITIEADGTRRSIHLRAGEETAMSLPPPTPGRDTLLSVRTSSGFRPSQMDPGNQDLRQLGCWVEVRFR